MNRRRIMIIDDDAETLDLMIKQLDALYDTQGFSLGKDALEALKCVGEECFPDLILLDISMKGMDGYEVLDRLKENEKYKRIPVVFLTGMTDEVSECRGLEMDVIDYLKKPVPGKVLLARLQHYLDLYSDTGDKGQLNESMLEALPSPLTEREHEVAKLMAEFRSDREISEILFISMPYTKKLVASVKEKLQIEKRGDIRRYLI
ncbi:MAG: DNA-binding response regulator [Lachnospiraceae bacterium]|nr:DNA-binding response regulator [Lachnospiraceae bacterium]